MDAKQRWFKIHDESGALEFLTSSKSFVRSPITNDDLGRYRCVATNSYGSRFRDAILSRIDNQIEFLTYGFVDKQQEEPNDLYRTPNVVNLRMETNQYLNQSKPILAKVRYYPKNSNFGEPVSFNCYNGKKTIISIV